MSNNITLSQLDEDLELIPDKDITRDRNVVIGSLVLEGDLGFNVDKWVPRDFSDVSPLGRA